MAYIPLELINKIRVSNDIVDVIGSYISLTPKGKNFFGVCPFHEDHSPSMSVSKEKQLYKCFSCGEGGNVITFVMNYEKVSFYEALVILGNKVGITLEKYETPKEDTRFSKHFEICEKVCSLYKNNLESKEGSFARDYLKNRGLDKETIDKFDIGLSLNNNISNILANKYDASLLIDLDISRESNGKLYDSFVDRIIFPIKNSDGQVVAFSGRIYKPSNDSKYKNSKETPIFIKGNTLYNLNNAKEYIRKEKSVIICEGFMDVIRLWSIGIKNAIALMGTSFTKEQFNIVKNLKVPIILNLDQDEAGRIATISLGDTLQKEKINSSVILFTDFKDSDEYIVNKGKDAFNRALNNRVNFIDFKLNYMKKQVNLNDSVELSKFINEAIKNINEIDDDILREIKVRELSKNFGISEEVIMNKITKREQVPIPIVKDIKKVKKYNKIDKSEFRILYLMMEHQSVIKIYEKTLGYLINENRSDFASEIVIFKEKNKTFNQADFISYICNNELLNNVFKEVNSIVQSDEYTDEELDDYINTIKKYSVKQEIDKLSIKLKDTLDLEEKKKIAKRIENMKKDVLKW